MKVGTQAAPQLLHFANGTEVTESQRKQSLGGGGQCLRVTQLKQILKMESSPLRLDRKLQGAQETVSELGKGQVLLE